MNSLTQEINKRHTIKSKKNTDEILDGVEDVDVNSLIDFIDIRYTSIDADVLRTIIAEHANDECGGYLWRVKEAFYSRKNVAHTFSKTKKIALRLNSFMKVGEWKQLNSFLLSHEDSPITSEKTQKIHKDLVEISSRFDKDLLEAHARTLIDYVLKNVLSSPRTIDLEREIRLSTIDEEEEKTIVSGPVDYAIMEKFDSKIILGIIEAKRHGLLKPNYATLFYSESQLFLELFSYFFDKMEDHNDSLDVQYIWGILSSGLCWRIYILDQNGRFGIIHHYDLFEKTEEVELQNLLRVLHILINHPNIVREWLNKKLKEEVDKIRLIVHE